MIFIIKMQNNFMEMALKYYKIQNGEIPEEPNFMEP